MAADVSDIEQTKNYINTTVNKWGKIDFLFANAGISGVIKPIAEYPEEIFDAVLAVNLRGSYLACKYGIPQLIRQGGGSIINTGSTGTYQCGSRQRLAAYYASKGGLTTLTRSIAMQYAVHNIRANIIQPGMVDTPMQKHWEKTQKEEWAKNIPLSRWAQAEDIANCALFLASDESDYITGAAFVVDGGFMTKLY